MISVERASQAEAGAEHKGSEVEMGGCSRSGLLEQSGSGSRSERDEVRGHGGSQQRDDRVKGVKTETVLCSSPLSLTNIKGPT